MLLLNHFGGGFVLSLLYASVTKAKHSLSMWDGCCLGVTTILSPVRSFLILF